MESEFTTQDGPSPDRSSGAFLEANIPGFKLLGKLGEGSFGTVYEAEQSEPVRRRVALKIIKPGMDSKDVLARFQAERQALAVMDHPCIAKIIDGGVTDRGRPYFAMELVRGVPITEHCDRHRLSVQERVALFIRVCEAVQHAHSKGLIHRDLKPSNILVSYEEGQKDGVARSVPKVIDFGVAKALNQRLTEQTIFTERGQLIGTPEYMSPEQAEMSGQDIDTRSDVYSLGIILYELLTGARPLESESLRRAGFAEIQRLIREVEPPKPSTRLSALPVVGDEPTTASRVAQSRRTELRSLTSTLKRDLDWVVMKCLEKDRERRYETASSLAGELARYLNDEPVLAGPPSAGYRLSKFVRRNKLEMTIVGVFAGIVVLAIAGLGYGYSQSLKHAAVLNERLESSERVVAELARGGSTAWDSSTSRTLFETAYEEALNNLGPLHPETLRSQRGLVDALLRHTDETEEALRLAQDSLSNHKKTFGFTDTLTIHAGWSFAWALLERGQCDESVRLYQELLDITLEHHPDDAWTLAFSTGNLMYGLNHCGRYPEVLEVAAAFDSRWSELTPLQRRRTLHYRLFTGVALRETGQLVEAIEQLSEVFALGVGEFGASAGNWTAAWCLPELLRAYLSAGMFEDGIDLLEGVYESTKSSPVSTAIADLYEAWHESEPGNGYDDRAVEWRERL